jgi:two-component system chemotaxis response regulator CheB
LIAIGASTGGVEAIEVILRDLPPDCPGLLIAQHIPAGFSRAFAERLDSLCVISVKEAAEGDEVFQGRALIAPGNRHMAVRREAGRFRVAIIAGPPVCYQRPSVDVLFASVAETAGPAAVAALLTGMGSDGAQGMLRIRRAGGRTLAQDEATSVVFGMPREAIRLGAAEQVLSLPAISATLLRLAARRSPITGALAPPQPDFSSSAS